MKKLEIIGWLALFLCLAIAVCAAGIPDGFAPNGKKNVSLTANSQTIDLRMDAAYSIFPQRTTCKYRIMSSATKAGAKQSLPALVRTINYVNKVTPYLNTTSCGGGDLQRQ